MLYPKYHKHLKAKETKEFTLKIPNNWRDFARMVKIRSGNEVVPFVAYDYQEKLVELMLERSVVIAKSRQLGISETITSFLLWRACLNPGYLALVFSKTQQDSSLLARRMQRMISSLGLKTATQNVSDIEILGRGRILFRNSNPDSARGIESVCDCFLDELAFLESGKEIYDSLAPAMQMLGDKARVFAVSTPNGKNGFYWDLLNSGNKNIDVELLCENVSKGHSEPFQYWVDEGNWNKVIIHWKCHPIYGKNPNFLDEVNIKLKLSKETIAQEYDLSFSEAECNVFSAEYVREGAKGQLEEAVKGGMYFIGIDSATTGSDYATCVVIRNIDVGIFSVVHVYRKRNQSTEYHLFYIGEIIKKYLPIHVAVEVTGGVGQIWLESLYRSYPHINFIRTLTTGDTKPAMIDRIKLLIERGRLIYPSDSPLVQEMLNFRRIDGKLSAPSGQHDDVLMGLCFACQAGKDF